MGLSGNRKKDHIFIFRLKSRSLISAFEVCSYQYKINTFANHLKNDS